MADVGLSASVVPNTLDLQFASDLLAPEMVQGKIHRSDKDGGLS